MILFPENLKLDKIIANYKHHRMQLLCYTYSQGSSYCISFSELKKKIKTLGITVREKENWEKKGKTEKVCRNQIGSTLMVPLCGKIIGPEQTLHHFLYSRTSDLYIKI